MRVLFSSAVLALACLAAPSAAFAPATSSFHRADVQLSGSKQNDFDAGKAIGTTAVAAALFVSNVLGGADIAMAAMEDNNIDFAGSSTLVSARSGGRAGGRASAARPAPSRSTTTYQRTTVVQPPVVVAPPPVVVSPFGGYGYGYNPLGGVGLGLSAVNAVGNEIRDYRQESEIRQSRTELEIAKQREADMAARIQQLEMNQRMQQMQQMQQPLPVQPQVAPAQK